MSYNSQQLRDSHGRWTKEDLKDAIKNKIKGKIRFLDPTGKIRGVNEVEHFNPQDRGLGLKEKLKEKQRQNKKQDVTTPEEREAYQKIEKFPAYEELARNYFNKLKDAPPPYKEELMGISEYTGKNSLRINDYLRYDYDKEKRRKKNMDIRVKMINAGLEKMPVHEGTVFRGALLPRFIVDQYAPGETIKEDAFVSASKKNQVAKGFLNSSLEDEENESVQYIINSKKGRSVKDVSVNPLEEEVLFKSGTSFKVLKNEYNDNGVRCIYMDEV